MLTKQENLEGSIRDGSSGVSNLSRRDFLQFWSAAAAILAAPGLAEAGEQEMDT